MFAKNYRKKSLFERVMAKMKRCSFLPHSVYVHKNVLAPTPGHRPSIGKRGLFPKHNDECLSSPLQPL